MVLATLLMKAWWLCVQWPLTDFFLSEFVRLCFKPTCTFGIQSYLYLSLIMCHMEKRFLCSFQFSCKINSFYVFKF